MAFQETQKPREKENLSEEKVIVKESFTTKANKTENEISSTNKGRAGLFLFF